MDKEETPEEYVKNRVADINAKKGFNFAKTNPDYPAYLLQKDKVGIDLLCRKIEAVLPETEVLIKKIYSHISSITEQTKITSVYLLLGKAFSNLQSCLILCRNGKNAEAMELSRSGKEALELAMLFWEDENKNLLEKWFNGKIISNSQARDFQHKLLNKELADTFQNEEQPIDEMLKKSYGIMSIYTHGAYAGLLDSVDVFKLDFDYEKYAGYHYCVDNFHIVQDLLIKILLQLKNSFVHLRDDTSFQEANRILEPFDNNLTPEQMKEIMAKHKKSP